MKKFLAAFLLVTPAAVILSSCKTQTDYFEYVSEYRHGVYYYEDDNFEIKVYSVTRETPYALDGVKGKTEELTEIYFCPESTPKEVNFELNGQGGEMSYLSVTQNFYLSFGGGNFSGAVIPAKLTVDGKEYSFDLTNVAEEGTIDGKHALKCVYEYDRESFEKLTEGNSFRGEINLRLLYDEGCFYYVGLCDRSGSVHAYLVDGVDGRIIAERTGEN